MSDYDGDYGDYFEDVPSPVEDDEIYRQFLALDESDESKSSASSDFDLHLSALGVTESQVTEFIEKTEDYVVKVRKNSLLQKLPDKNVLPHFLKNLLSTQVRSPRSEEAFQKARNRQDFGLDDGLTQADGTSVKTEISADLDPRGAGVKALEVRANEQGQRAPRRLRADKARKFYLEKEIGRRGADWNTGDGIDSQLHRRWSRTVWRQEMENLEPEYRLPVLILRKFRYIRENEPTRLGPGTYDANFYQIQKDKKNRLTKGAMKSCTFRFPKEKMDNENPGPGAYGNLGNEEAENRYKHPGKITMLQSGPCDVRGKTFKALGSRLGPGQYQVSVFFV
jgi:hypothetical protein